MHYQLYSLPATKNPALSTSADTPEENDDRLDIFYKAESNLRDRGILVYVDVEEQELWVFFQATTNLSEGQGAEQYMLEACGVSLQCMSLSFFLLALLMTILCRDIYKLNLSRYAGGPPIGCST